MEAFGHLTSKKQIQNKNNNNNNNNDKYKDKYFRTKDVKQKSVKRIDMIQIYL